MDRSGTGVPDPPSVATLICGAVLGGKGHDPAEVHDDLHPERVALEGLGGVKTAPWLATIRLPSSVVSLRPCVLYHFGAAVRASLSRKGSTTRLATAYR